MMKDRSRFVDSSLKNEALHRLSFVDLDLLFQSTLDDLLWKSLPSAWWITELEGTSWCHFCSIWRDVRSCCREGCNDPGTCRSEIHYFAWTIHKIVTLWPNQWARAIDGQPGTIGCIAENTCDLSWRIVPILSTYIQSSLLLILHNRLSNSPLSGSSMTVPRSRCTGSRSD